MDLLQITLIVIFMFGMIITLLWSVMVFWKAICIPKNFVNGYYHNIQIKRKER